MLLRVDESHLESLRSHLDAQGFPAARIGDDTLDVLFPASTPLFAAAVELDDWLARAGADVSVQVEGESARA
jgi:hypothetical protein